MPWQKEMWPDWKKYKQLHGEVNSCTYIIYKISLVDKQDLGQDPAEVHLKKATPWTLCESH